MPVAVLPISLVFSTLRREYIEGLTAYRYAGPAEAPQAVASVRQWVATFVEAAIAAVEQSHRIMGELQELRAGWAEQVADHRRAKGQRFIPRSDSGAAKLSCWTCSPSPSGGWPARSSIPACHRQCVRCPCCRRIGCPVAADATRKYSKQFRVGCMRELTAERRLGECRRARPWAAPDLS